MMVRRQINLPERRIELQLVLSGSEVCNSSCVQIFAMILMTLPTIFWTALIIKDERIRPGAASHGHVPCSGYQGVCQLAASQRIIALRPDD